MRSMVALVLVALPTIVTAQASVDVFNSGDLRVLFHPSTVAFNPIVSGGEIADAKGVFDFIQKEAVKRATITVNKCGDATGKMYMDWDNSVVPDIRTWVKNGNTNFDRAAYALCKRYLDKNSR